MALGGLCDSEFPVTPGNCRHLAGLMLVRLWKGLLFIVADSGHWLCEELCAHPRGRLTKSNYCKINRGLERSLVIYYLLCEVVI